MQHQSPQPPQRVAVVQTAPIGMDCAATTAKVRALVAEAAQQGAHLVLFPEALIPGYPWGLHFGTVVGQRSTQGRKAWQRYWANAVDVPGPTTAEIGAAARQHNCYVVIGVVERDQATSGGTLYCTVLYFGPDGSLLGKHRKLKPTAAERYIWGEGDGSTMPVIPTPAGNMGALICWENYMPLARMAMYAKGVELYLAPTADSRDTWQATIQHIACEGRCFVLSSCQYATRAVYPDDFELPDEVATTPDVLSRGGSAIVSPLGDYLAGPLFDSEGVLIAEIDLALITQGRYDFDVTGHYARPDVFQLRVNTAPQASVIWTDNSAQD